MELVAVKVPRLDCLPESVKEEVIIPLPTAV